MRPPGRAEDGLTLIEITVALAMLAVLASLAVPELGRHLARTHLRASAEHLALSLSQARFDAARRGQAMHLAIEPGERWCWSVSDAPGCGCQQVAVCQRERVAATRGQAVRIDTGLQLTFAPSADARLEPAVVDLGTRYGDRLQVRLTPMGRARVCVPPAPGAGPDAAALRPACS